VHQFNLVDVNFVNIEHRAAIQGDTIDLGDIEMNRTNLLEYWEGGQGTDGNYDSADDTMNKRWGNVEENRLKIRFKHAQMSLFLRYMSDLKDMEDKSKVSLVAADDSNCLMNHIGAETKIWCRTIARLRGANNLEQSLPHFGNDSKNEMVDFIELCGRYGEGRQNEPSWYQEQLRVTHERDIELAKMKKGKMREKVQRRFSSTS